MGRYIIFTALVAASALGPFVANGQSQSTWGVILGGAYNIHDANFQRLGTYPSCCPTFNDGSGIGYSLGTFYRINALRGVILEPRIVLLNESGSFTFDERSVVADLRDSLRVVRATFQHRVDASILSIGIEPVFAFRLSKVFEVLAGPRLSVNLQQQFTQSETLTQPEDYGAYLGKDRTWINTQATIPNTTAPRVSMLAGLRVALPLKERSPLQIGLEFLYAHGLNTVSSGTDWSIHQLRMAANISFRSTEHLQQPVDSCRDCTKEIAHQILPVPDTLSTATEKDSSNTVGKPKTRYDLLIAEVVDGAIKPGSFSIYEHLRRVVVLHPLLGHIYFEQGSVDLPQRYQQGIAKALLDTLSLTPLEALQGELAIIAQRMKKHPDSWLNITGTTSSISGDQGLELARARAETVRLRMNILGISNDRMKISARVYPDRPTTFSDQTAQRLAQEENRRVELSSNNPAILSPVKLGVVEKLFFPERIAVIVKSDESSLQPMRVILQRNRDTLQQITSKSATGNDTSYVDTRDLLLRGDGPLVVTTENQLSDPSTTKSKVINVPILQDESEYTRVARQGDFEIERYGLILFEFDEVRISKQHERQLQFIRDRIKENTVVTIIGATDQIGTGDYNKELSLKRAREVARKLGIPEAIVVGNGEENPALPNNLPEGRASNRTVIIQLATPVK